MNWIELIPNCNFLQKLFVFHIDSTAFNVSSLLSRVIFLCIVCFSNHNSSFLFAYRAFHKFRNILNNYFIHFFRRIQEKKNMKAMAWRIDINDVKFNVDKRRSNADFSTSLVSHSLEIMTEHGSFIKLFTSFEERILLILKWLFLILNFKYMLKNTDIVVF